MMCIWLQFHLAANPAVDVIHLTASMTYLPSMGKLDPRLLCQSLSSLLKVQCRASAAGMSVRMKGQVMICKAQVIYGPNVLSLAFSSVKTCLEAQCWHNFPAGATGMEIFMRPSTRITLKCQWCCRHVRLVTIGAALWTQICNPQRTLPLAAIRGWTAPTPLHPSHQYCS